eukprot:3937361-Rhodomonas_salina.1
MSELRLRVALRELGLGLPRGDATSRVAELRLGGVAEAERLHASLRHVAEGIVDRQGPRAARAPLGCC